MTESESPESSGALTSGSDVVSRAEPAAGSVASESAAPAPSSRRLVRREPSARTGRGTAGAFRAKRSTPRDQVRAGVAAPAPGSWRRTVSRVGVMTVVAGVLASLTLPAFADQKPVLSEEAAPLAGQSIQISTASATSDSSRDSYGITSADELRRLYAAAMREQNLAAYLASGARDMGDDYPWPDALSRPQGGGLSPLRYYYRECVDFVAWRLNRDVGSTAEPFRWTWANLAQGSAYSWKNAWEAKNWPTGTTPSVGAVAWFPGGNHVAYVSAVLDDGSVVLEEYNYSVNNGYGQRVIPASGAYYLYAPPL